MGGAPSEALGPSLLTSALPTYVHSPLSFQHLQHQTMKRVWQAEKWLPKDVLILILGTCEDYCEWQKVGAFADVSK